MSPSALRPAFIVLVGIIMLGCFYVTGCGGTQATEDDIWAKKLEPRVDFSFELLDGGVAQVKSYRKKWVVLHFFTTDNQHSTRDVEQLRNVKNAKVIGIAMDAQPRSFVPGWRKAMDASYFIGLPQPDIQKASLLPLTSLPTTIVLNPEGRIAARRDRALLPDELLPLLFSLKNAQKNTHK